MYKFEYVRKEERMHIKKFIIYSLNFVQNILKRNYSYKYSFMGHEIRSMMTRDIENDLGYQYEIEILVNDAEEYFTAKGLTMLFYNALSQFQPKYEIELVAGDDFVIQTSIKNKRVDDLLIKVDFSIVRIVNEKKYAVKYDKIKNDFYFKEKIEDKELNLKEQWCKDNNYWNEVRDLFLFEKNKEENALCKDRELYKNVLDGVCEYRGYKN